MLFLILVIVAVVLIIKQAAKETSAQRRAREAREKADEASRRYKELRSKNKSKRSAPTPEDILQAAIERAEKRIREAVPPLTEKPPVIDGHPLRYRYRLGFEPSDESGARQLLQSCLDHEVGLKVDGERLQLVKDDTVLGKTPESKFARMVADFKESGEPVRAIIRDTCGEFELQFYRDLKRRNTWRAQTVTYLLGYQTEEIQRNIQYADIGMELQLDEDRTPGHYIQVFACGRKLGVLPLAPSERVRNEYVFLVTMEKVEAEGSADAPTYVPYVRLFWYARIDGN